MLITEQTLHRFVKPAEEGMPSFLAYHPHVDFQTATYINHLLFKQKYIYKINGLFPVITEAGKEFFKAAARGELDGKSRDI